MFGNLVNNRQLLDLRKNKVIEIEPFNMECMSLAHYTLHIRKIKQKLPNGSLKTIHDFREDNNPYSLNQNDYVIVQIEEVIRINEENIVGHFIPASNLIEDGLGLVAGKIDKKYGSSMDTKKQEMIQFGLKNFLNQSVLITPFYRIAHLNLFDLRGVTSEKVKLSETELKIRLRRMIKEMDDGVHYSEEE